MAFCFAFRTRFAFVFRCRQALQVRNRPKSIRGFFWLQEEQNWSVGSPVDPYVGSPIPVGLPVGSSCSLCGPSQPSLPSTGPFCRPIEPVGPVKLSRGLFQPSLPLSRPSQPSLSPGNPLYPSCRSVKRSPPSVEPSQASLTPVKSS